MSIDYGEKEREFLESLATETGRDLEGWMSAIRAANLTTRNDIIDWLRHQGFVFSKASWLERIFNNEGKPIYSARGTGKAAERTRAPARPRTTVASPSPANMPVTAPPMPAPAAPMAPAPPAAVMRSAPPLPPPQVQAQRVTSAPPPEAAEASLETTLAKAKAFRPLASFLLGELRKVLPAAKPEPYPQHIAIVLEGREVAILALSPKDIRLFISAVGTPFDAGFSAAKLPPGLIGMRMSPTHMTALTDVRAVTPDMIDRVRAAALKAAGNS